LYQEQKAIVAQSNNAVKTIEIIQSLFILKIYFILVPPKDQCIFEPNFIATEFGGERNRSEGEKIPELHNVRFSLQLI
jgi:hypothetical protein